MMMKFKWFLALVGGTLFTISDARTGLNTVGTSPTARGFGSAALFGQSIVWAGGVSKDFDNTTTSYAKKDVSLLNLNTLT